MTKKFIDFNKESEDNEYGNPRIAAVMFMKKVDSGFGRFERSITDGMAELIRFSVIAWVFVLLYGLIWNNRPVIIISLAFLFIGIFSISRTVRKMTRLRGGVVLHGEKEKR